MIEEPALTVFQVAKRLSISHFTVRNLIVSGRLRAFVISQSSKRKAYRVEPAWVREFIESNRLPELRRFEPIPRERGLSSKKKYCKRLPRVEDAKRIGEKKLA